MNQGGLAFETNLPMFLFQDATDSVTLADRLGGTYCLFLSEILCGFSAKRKELVFETNQCMFLFQNTMGKHGQSIDSGVLDRIQSHGKGWVFTPADFLDLGSRTAVGLALMRHRRTGEIRQLARGLYDYPDQDPRLGLLSPSTDLIAQALKGRDASRLQPTGAYAANILGLSDQVPTKTVFLSDGPSRRVRLGNREIVIKHTTLRNMATTGTASGLVIHALRWLGQRHVNDQTFSILKSRLPTNDRRGLLKDARYAPAWVAEIMRRLAESGKD